MKRITAILASLGLIVVTAAGCGSGKNAGKVPVNESLTFDAPLYDWNRGSGETLVVWGTYPDLDRSYLRRAFERFEEMTDDRLELISIPQDEFEAQMLASVRGEKEKPDILLSYGGTNIEAYDPDENFYDFSDAVWVEDLTDTSINQTVFNGRIIGLPHWEASISGTLYNKKIFEKFDIKVPETQEEFMEVCRILLDHGVTPLYLPGRETSMLLYQFPLDSVVEKPEVLAQLNDGTAGYADLPEMETVAAWYRTMADQGYFGDHYLSNDWDGMNDAMESEEYAMMLCWDTWLYTDFKGDPSVFGLMPAFMGVPENGTFEGPNLGLFIVNRKSERLEAALNFIKFLSDPYNYNVAFERIYTAPVFNSQTASISTPQYLEAERLIERNFRDSTAWLRIRGFSQMDASCILEYMNHQLDTPDECLRKMDQLRSARLELQEK